MVKRIYLKFGYSVQLERVPIAALPVTLTVYDNAGLLQELGSGYYLSLLPKNLRNSFRKWQKYIAPHPDDDSVRRIKLEPINPNNNLEIDDSNINFEQLANNFKTNLNQWLNEEAWLNEYGNNDTKIKQVLESYYSEKEEIQIFLQTENRELRGLPWQEWDVLQKFFINHSNTEVSISATNFKRPEQQQTLLLDARIRILAVFGDEKLGLDEEKTLIVNLEKYGGLIKLLHQPDRLTLEQALQEPKGWHIFFFAGHSGSDENGKIGWIEINPSEKISIDNLTTQLDRLIRDKLQLAIFNSCDGLGLANQLTSLSLPYCIVMREPVESLFARRLLRHLLTAFVKGKSLFASMRTARESLRKEFDEEGKHPGKSWLPVIVANPEARPLTWDGMFTERRLDRKWEFLLFTILLIAIIGLPLSIWAEFGNINTLKLYAQLYPHLVIYPSLFLWISLYGLYRAICLIRQKAKIFWGFTAVVFVLSCIALALDLNTDPTLLLELKPNATTVVYPQKFAQEFNEQRVFKNDLKTIPKDLLDITQIIDSRGNITAKKQNIEESLKKFISTQRQEQENRNYQGYNSFLRNVLKYHIWKGQFSFSRWFYAFSYFIIFFCAAEIFALLMQNLLAPNSVFKKHKYISYLIICDTGLLLWYPFYYYYTDQIKSLLFDINTELTNLAGLVYLFIFSLLVMTLVVTMSQIKVAKYRHILSLIVIAIVALTNLMIIHGSAFLIDQMFGISSHSTFITWIGSISFFVFIFILVIYLIDNKVTEI
ncbi:CHAT domain-containing protein [Nostoc spongiaeforme FACHB-130]|uniref:CHAT domain-containing protein n=1 Tax=Nostoc spongiaeforme FACHB-130 TaxID=1357510 RepID=A0ABR8FYK3_9NOSO|nr:CHAT domain-containing protein [Nostoc spongiaeforme]MBD2596015.1 CHAT domain-containing protein [Nostoc spongiaeforme FACHB-130]